MKDCLDRYSGLVWSLARGFSSERAEAEDAVQEIFIDVWRNAARYKPEIASEATFVATIARRRLIDRYRRTKRRPFFTPLEGTDAAGDGRIRDETIQSHEVDRALEGLHLRPAHRRVLRLALFEQRTHSEIAALTGLPLGTVKTFMRRGLARLRARLSPVGEPALNGCVAAG